MNGNPPAVHHTIMVTDTENFTDPERTNLDQLAFAAAFTGLSGERF